MPPSLRWDIFCRVVDNFGDAGVCWRLARKLARRAYLMAVGAIAAEIDPRTVGSHDDLARFYLG